VESLDQNAIKAVKIITEPDPSDAGPEEDFGFTETIITYPDTL
jgi:hypothetical protein